MAILNQIRQRSLFLILVIAMALFSFVLADVIRNGSGFSLPDQNVIATINGIEMEREDFMRKVENLERQNRGSGTNVQSMNTIWDVELRKLVLASEYDKLGITVERDLMRDILKNNLLSFDEFKDSQGEFDQRKLNEFISNLKEISPETMDLQGAQINYESWTNYESTLASSGLEKIYFDLIRSGINSTVFEGKTQYNYENDNIDLKYVKIPFSTIPDSLVKVTKSDVKKYMQKNENDYKVKASRNLIYVRFEENPSKYDERELETQLTDLVNDREEFDFETKTNKKILGFKNTQDNEEFLNLNSAIKLYDSYVFENSFSKQMASIIYSLNKGELHGPYKEGEFIKITKLLDSKKIPDSVKVRHILIPYSGSLRSDPNETRTKEQAKKKADSIYRIVLRRPSKFKSLLSLSSDIASNENDGEIEFSYVDGFAPEFKDFSFQNRVGKISVVETDFGFHIIEILSQSKRKKAVKVANLALKLEASERTIDSVFNVTSKFEIALEKSNFRDVANEFNYKVNPVNNIRELNENIPGVGSQRAIVRWAYNPDTNLDDVRKFNLQNGGYLVAMLTSINPEGLMSIDKASITAIAKIRNEKKAKMIMDKIKGKSLEDISSSQNQTIQTALAVNMKNPVLSGTGNEPNVVGYAFGIDEGKTSKGIAGNNGVFYIKVDRVKYANVMNSYQNYTNLLNSIVLGSYNSKVYEALLESSEIEDNRSLFY
ncbi:MAG TPA: peptidylprolyl isomerase [Flavobacteriaceae bacterium]|nr:peptidylprolyl isomerase [Flavobacteriaceae bacterium]